LSIVKGCVDVVDETVGLVNNGVTSAEAELVGRYEAVGVDEGKETAEEDFLKDFGDNG
jgi:hypothetical protein